MARVVLSARGRPVGDAADFSPTLTAAHSELVQQQGPGLSQTALGVASDAKKMANRLRELRNDYGTGHGRAHVPVVEDEVILLALDGALVWVRWALRRLEHVLAGALVPLLNDLQHDVFRTGELARRLLQANVPALVDDDQRRLGVAVGQRASRGTFLAREEGLVAPVRDENDARWPLAYREGAVEGTFLNAAGQLQVDDGLTVIRPAAQLAASMPDAAEFLRRLRAKLAAASWSPSFAQAWPQIRDVMQRNLTEFTDLAPREGWADLIGDLQVVGAALEADAR
ncbi:abortive infection family protein [Micromonospora sp. URMC 103]|uniref:abortive infection family protein n=1 Tax=Micromonospora sp. URMC 103 TaxID=3423406 RepID=UPI003F1A3C5A